MVLKKRSAVVQSKLLTVRQAHEDGFRQSPVTLSCLVLPTSFWWLIHLWGAPQCLSRQQLRQFPGRGFLFYKNTAEVDIQDFSLSGVWGYYLSVFQDEVTCASSGFNFWSHKGPKSLRVSFCFPGNFVLNFPSFGPCSTPDVISRSTELVVSCFCFDSEVFSPEAVLLSDLL